ncbi:MAG TPA: flavin prenyltransferase UbiX [Candidatus Acidoferrales bacterium]|nr:flavin prenyltransferase UbiX [Candidatus Acidoferrales bacterium]
MSRAPVALAWTGASGAAYGVRLLECLLQAGERVYLMVSRPGLLVINGETDLGLPGRAADVERQLATHFNAAPDQLRVFGQDEWTAPVASGSARFRAMVVCPCSMATLAAIAGGASRSLIERAADVTIKEQRRLILVPRETPFSAVHLENMLALARLGVIIAAANPGFYHRPVQASDLVDYLVARLLDLLDVPHQLLPRWGESD